MDAATPKNSDARIFPRLDPAAIQGARIVLCDLDGCLMSAGRAFDDAVDYVEACGERIWVVSNRSDMTAPELSVCLRHLGLQIPPSRIILAGEFALDHLSGHGIRRLALYAAPALHAHARRLGLDPDDAEDPEAVLLCRDPALTVDGMGPLLNMLDSGAPLWVSNEDLSHPDHRHRPIAETGALLAALRAIRPDLTWQSLGKPEPAMLLHALRLSGNQPGDAIFVGDNPTTDGAAAAAAGIPFHHIQRARKS